MKDEDKTKEQLVSELADLRRRNAELVRSESLYRQAVEKRKESEECLQNLFNTISEGVVLIDSNGLIVEANASAMRIAGLKRTEIIGKRSNSPDWKLLRPDGTRMPPKEMAGPRTMKEKRPIKDLIMGVERPDGGISWINTNTTPIIDETGKLDSIVLTFSDITQHKQAEDELRNSEERLKVLFEFAPDAYYLNDAKGNFVDGNIAAERLTGYKRKDLIGKNFLKLNLLTSKQFPKAAGLLAKNLLGQPTGPDEFVLNRKDGTQVPVEISTYPVKIKDKTLILGIARDISDREHAVENLRKSEGRLTEAQRIAHLGNWDWNIQNKELSWSDEIYRIFGLKPQEFGATYEAFLNSVHPDDRELVKEAVNKALQKKKPYSIDHRIVLPDGSERAVHEQAKVFFNDKGEPTRMLGTVQDITERKRAEEALQRAHHELELRVEERTAELKATNEALENEISVREKAEEALKLDEERLEILLRLSHIDIGTEEELTDFALEECVRLTQSKVGYLHFFSEDQKSIQLYSWSKKTLKECTAEKALHYPLEKAGIWADCLRLRKPVIHNDYQSMPDKKGFKRK
jgi:PAS domain S-box-containing protein